MGAGQGDFDYAPGSLCQNRIVDLSCDIYGDGVNVAARLEGLAEPGGICISGTAFDHAVSKANVGFASLGEQRLKNIADPVRVYRVLLNPSKPGKIAGRSYWPGARTVILTTLLAGAPKGKRRVDKVPHGRWKTATFLAALRNDAHGAFAEGIATEINTYNGNNRNNGVVLPHRLDRDR